MKKIIKHGFKYYMETTCPYCGCYFSYEYEDLIKKPYTWTCSISSLYSYNGYTVKCPECYSEIMVGYFPNIDKPDREISFDCKGEYKNGQIYITKYTKED